MRIKTAGKYEIKVTMDKFFDEIPIPSSAQLYSKKNIENAIQVLNTPFATKYTIRNPRASLSFRTLKNIFTNPLPSRISSASVLGLDNCLFLSKSSFDSSSPFN